MSKPLVGKPRYRAIADDIRARIGSGSFTPGSLLPAEQVLCSEYRASRGTIRKAVSILREEGVVATEHGRGTSVLIASELTSNPGLHPGGGEQRTIGATEELARLFDVPVGTRLLEVRLIEFEDTKVRSVTSTFTVLDSWPS
ncbi:GntR family transcriptional regulator [Micromonospora reichwaldensis]|uniref:GntR family transcriptional regulator n=1 Tax=Micromonospora reichwaldensis TaxID=3075516 RepID=UPI0037C8F122